MKKEWKKPELQVLDVRMTMLGSAGEFTDATFPENTPKGKLTFC
ncbi:paeninodin family lasso peptide [Neobacillus novalis]|uniref:Paeninodin family lasso peptide n=1 Tax=Neobacillus novalis TaxID=220687 RepID=A0AA95SBN8_9BACI|nr:paeninodin family lasso peptide [Neobacillus novalis]WHY85213.1 paeninodin family lasso peptide [Neobacillus novalis]